MDSGRDLWCSAYCTVARLELDPKGRCTLRLARGRGEGGKNEDDDYFDLLPNISMSPLDRETEPGQHGHIAALLARLGLAPLLTRWPPRLVWAIYMLVNGFITIVLLGLLAVFTHNPFVFPSLGPTAYLFFFTPLAEASSPRNAIVGHAIGLVCGYAAFVIAGVGSHAGPADVLWPRVLASALSLSMTGAAMVLLDIHHPPAGATTMIVSLGIISQPRELLIIEAAVVLLTAQAFLINRLAGLRYPMWESPKAPPERH